jgi:hypothetical protein
VKPWVANKMVENIHQAIDICNKVLILVGVIFPLTTAYMFVMVRLQGENPILQFSQSNFSISFNLKLVDHIRQRYVEIKKGRMVPLLNRISCHVGFAAFIIYFSLVILDTMA